MSQALGGIVKTAMADLGINPENYSAHSLRKTRPSYAMSQNSSMTESMVHDGRSSEVTGLVYAHRNPRNPLDGDPTVNAYNKTCGPTADQPATTAGPAQPTEPETPATPEPPGPLYPGAGPPPRSAALPTARISQKAGPGGNSRTSASRAASRAATSGRTSA